MQNPLVFTSYYGLAAYQDAFPLVFYNIFLIGHAKSIGFYSIFWIALLSRRISAWFLQHILEQGHQNTAGAHALGQVPGLRSLIL